MKDKDFIDYVINCMTKEVDDYGFNTYENRINNVVVLTTDAKEAQKRIALLFDVENGHTYFNVKFIAPRWRDELFETIIDNYGVYDEEIEFYTDESIPIDFESIDAFLDYVKNEELTRAIKKLA